MWTKDNPSPIYRAALEEARVFHLHSKAYDGMRTLKALAPLSMLCREHDAKTLLDYGCGKGKQYEARDIVMHEFGPGGIDGDDPLVPREVPSLAVGLGADRIAAYDPAVAGFDAEPVGVFDGVFSVDVFQIIHEDDAPWVIGAVAAFATKFVFAKFRLDIVRSKKTKIIAPLPLSRWLALFGTYVPNTLDLLLSVRDEERRPVSCRRRAGETSFAITTSNRKPEGK